MSGSDLDLYWKFYIWIENPNCMFGFEKKIMNVLRNSKKRNKIKFRIELYWIENFEFKTMILTRL